MEPSPNGRQDGSPRGFAVAGVIVVIAIGLGAMLAGLAFDHHPAGSWAAAIGFFTCCGAIFYARFIRE
jgi:hypothetical protein